MFDKILLTISILFSLTSFARVDAGQLFRDKLRVLDNDKIIFHWTTIDKVKDRTSGKYLSESLVNEYLENTVKYEIQKSLWNGLYFAANPVISSRFGLSKEYPLLEDKQWVLVQVELKKGTKLLDVSKSTSRKLTDEEKKWFGKFRCRAQETNDLGIDNVGSSSKCARALYKYLHAVKASGILYEWWDFDQDICLAHSDPSYKSRAIVLKNTRSLDSKNVTYFTSELPEEDESTLSKAKVVEALWQLPIISKYVDENRKRSLWGLELDAEFSFGTERLIDCNQRD